MSLQSSVEQFHPPEGRGGLHDLAGSIPLSAHLIDDLYEQQRSADITKDISQLRQREIAEARAHPLAQPIDQLTQLAAGYAWRSGPVAGRQDRATTFAAAATAGTPIEPLASVIGRTADLYYPAIQLMQMSQKQIDPLLATAKTTGDVFSILSQYIAEDDPSETADNLDRRDVLRQTMYAFYGPHADNSLLAKLQEALASGYFDSMIFQKRLRELAYEQPTIRNLVTALDGRFGPDSDWLRAATVNIHNVGPQTATAVRRQVARIGKRRQEMLVRLSTVNQQQHDTVGTIGIGLSGKVGKEIERIRGVIGERDARMRGQAVLDNVRGPHMPRVSVQEAPQPEQPATVEAERESWPVADRVFSYVTQTETTRTLAELTTDFAGRDEDRQAAVAAALRHIADSFKAADGTGRTGIKPIHKPKQAGVPDLYQFKADDAAGVQGVAKLQNYRVLFYEADGEIRLVGIENRRGVERLLKNFRISYSA